MNPSDSEIAFLKKFILDESGVIISTDKEYLLASRLGPIIRKLALNDYGELVEKLKLKNKEVTDKVIDALTTHETYFYRDIKPFEYFEKNILPDLIERKKNSINKTINIWCVACSSGQEPYSLNIILNENKSKLDGLNWKILGTDISDDVVKKAAEGHYSQFEVQRGLPAIMLIKYFEKEGENKWKVKDLLKQNIEFKTNNILEFQKLGLFDCVFCRNVLIYFEKDNKVKAAKNIYENMDSKASLFLGTSETSNLLPEKMDQSQEIRSVYFKK